MCARAIWSGLAGAAVLVSGGGCSAIDKQAAATFEKSLGDTSITVFSAYVRQGTAHRYDAPVAAALVAFIHEHELATAVTSDSEVPLESAWGMNQSRMFRESAADLADYVQAHPPDTAYAALPEYLLSGNGQVMGIHFYVVDGEGRLAYGVGLNSHHEPFQAIDPQDVPDCTRALLRQMAADLVSAEQ